MTYITKPRIVVCDDVPWEHAPEWAIGISRGYPHQSWIDTLPDRVENFRLRWAPGVGLKAAPIIAPPGDRSNWTRGERKAYRRLFDEALKHSGYAHVIVPSSPLMLGGEGGWWKRSNISEIRVDKLRTMGHTS